MLARCCLALHLFLYLFFVDPGVVVTLRKSSYLFSMAKGTVKAKTGGKRRRSEDDEKKGEHEAEKVVNESPQEEEEEEEPVVSMVPDVQIKRSTTTKTMSNRQKCLVLGGRNMNAKCRHLLLDLRGLMPHSREHSKIGNRNSLGPDLVEICNLHQCNSYLYLDPHRSDVNYMWLGQAPGGPSVKMQLLNVHTADEIRMAGNCLKYSRPLLHFDRAFETAPHLRVVKALLHMNFNTPLYHPKSKPFIDRVMSFMWLDDHIWVRNYQIVYSNETEASSLIEIGPRFTLEPVMILNGCCQGPVVWKSSVARPPTEQRRDRKMRRLEKLDRNEDVRKASELHRAHLPAPQADPLDMVFQ